jgi:peptidoglycan/LPS O-acetylase OafA/YrhL
MVCARSQSFWFSQLIVIFSKLVGWEFSSSSFCRGFLITGILLDMKASLPTREYFTKFYGRRFLRIFPLYYFYLAALAVVAYWLIRLDFRPKYMEIFFSQVWYAVVYVYDLFYRAPWFQPSQFLDHFWSLSVEEQFYIVWPLLLLVVVQRDLKKLFISFILMGLVFRSYSMFFTGNEFGFLREALALVIYSLPFSVDAFVMGGYIPDIPFQT